MDGVESELRALLSDTFNRSKLLAMLKDMQTETERKEARRATHTSRVPNSPVTVYTSIKRNFTCLHCGAKFYTIVELKKDESIPSLCPDGKTALITSKSPAEMDCATFCCKHCETFVNGLSRDALEARYMQLLRHTPLHHHTLFIQSLNIGVEERKEESGAEAKIKL